MSAEQVEWPQHVLDIRKALNDSIPSEWRLSPDLLAQYPRGSDVRPLASQSGILDSTELEITDNSKDATWLVEQIKNRKYTAEAVMLAFVKKTAVAQQAISCLADFDWQTALAKAKELDAHYEKTGQTVGPLHGLPISIKSQYNIPGRPSSAGFSSQEIMQDTAHAVEILQAAGAVVFCKTNLPQAIMALESLSFLGHTLNPLNTNLSSGGSSGGCSAIMGFGASPLSLGSDIGGSLRQPAACTGLWSLKPTAWRLPRDGMYKVNAGFDSIVGTAAAQCKSLRDLDTYLYLTLQTKPWTREQPLLPIPWRRGSLASPADFAYKGNNGKIRVGIMEFDGVIMPHPPILRGLRTLAKALQSHPEFEVVKYEPYQHQRGAAITSALYFPDGGARIRQVAKDAGEPLLPLTQFALGQPSVKERDIHGLWELNSQREAFKAEYFKHWNAQKIDIIIGPVNTQTAPLHGTSKYWGYTSIFNLLDYPGVTFPTGLIVDPKVDLPDAAYQPRSDTDAYVHGLYAPERYLNSPICLQATAYKFEDEKIFNILEKINALLPLA